MSNRDPSPIGRRSLFDAFRRALKRDENDDHVEVDAPKGPRFSLARFYAEREATEANNPPGFPRVTIREGIESIATTPVGAGERTKQS